MSAQVYIYLDECGRLQKVARPDVDGVVYFVRAGEFVKIGFTTGCPFERMAALQTANPVRLELMGTCPGGRCVEQLLHQNLSHARTEGEWFRLDDAKVGVFLERFCQPGVRSHANH